MPKEIETAFGNLHSIVNDNNHYDLCYDQFLASDILKKWLDKFF